MDKNKIYERYQHRAQYYGDEDLKKDLKRVKRVATEVAGFCKDYRIEDSLSAADAAKLRAAGEVLTRLAAAMEALPARARKEKADHDKRSAAEEAARLDKLAEGKPWAVDEASILREASMLGELLAGGHHVVEWVQHHLKRAEIKYLSWSAAYRMESRAHLNVLRDPFASAIQKRRSMAWVLDMFKVSSNAPGSQQYDLQPADYQAWKNWKEDMEMAMASICSRKPHAA